jgi:hypothetical protein
MPWPAVINGGTIAPAASPSRRQLLKWSGTVLPFLKIRI